VGNLKALIIGSEGQDGKLLKELLESKNYIVFGLGRGDSSEKNYLKFDLAGSDFNSLEIFIVEQKPDEIYYIAAFHHSSQEKNNNNFEFIQQSINVNQIAFIRVLEFCRVSSPKSKIIYTSSSLIYAGCGNPMQSELTLPEPRCVYSMTKCAAMEAAKFFRANYNLFVSVGIMYNHESKYRKDNFLSKKIVNEIRQIIEGKISGIKIGDMSSETDWGYAPDYVEALWHILQLNSPDTYIVSSGKSHKVGDWFAALSKYLNIDLNKFVIEDKSMIIRKKPILIGDNSKLLKSGWKPRTSFNEMVIKIYNNEI
jgi:GDPmannose 4,6-dehydratase